MDIITVRIYKCKAIYFGKDVSDVYGRQWEIQPDVKNRQIKARPSIKTGRKINNSRTIGIAAVVNKIGIDHLFVNRTAVTQVMTMGGDGWFTTNIEHPRTKEQRKIDVKKNAVSRDSFIIGDEQNRRQNRPDGVISLCIGRGKIGIPHELCGKVTLVYVYSEIVGGSYKINISTTKTSTKYQQRKVSADGCISFSDIKLLNEYIGGSAVRVQSQYENGIYTAAIKLGDKICAASQTERKPIEMQVKPDNQKMTFWQRVRFVFGW